MLPALRGHQPAAAPFCTSDEALMAGVGVLARAQAGLGRLRHALLHVGIPDLVRRVLVLPRARRVVVHPDVLLLPNAFAAINLGCVIVPALQEDLLSERRVDDPVEGGAGSAALASLTAGDSYYIGEHIVDTPRFWRRGPPLLYHVLGCPGGRCGLQSPWHGRHALRYPGNGCGRQ